MADIKHEPQSSSNIDNGSLKQLPGSRTDATSLLTQARSGTMTPKGSSFVASIGPVASQTLRTLAPGTQERARGRRDYDEDEGRMGGGDKGRAEGGEKVVSTTPRRKKVEKRRNKRDRR